MDDKPEVKIGIPNGRVFQPVPPRGAGHRDGTLSGCQAPLIAVIPVSVLT